jgi:hypothetical protein
VSREIGADVLQPLPKDRVVDDPAKDLTVRFKPAIDEMAAHSQTNGNGVAVLVSSWEGPRGPRREFRSGKSPRRRGIIPILHPLGTRHLVEIPNKTAAAPAAESSWKKGRPITIQYYRAQDKRGINVFETTKDPGVKFTGFKFDFGAAFTSQVQNLSHGNTATPNMVTYTN